MYNIQPGTGLGFTASKQIALGLGTFDIDIVTVVPTPVELVRRQPAQIIMASMSANKTYADLDEY